MERIISHIEYLLEHHDCVTVPGVGAFIKSYQPSRIDSTNNRILPPHRAIVFNSEINFDDGLLATSYSRALNQSFTVATATMLKDIELLKLQLTMNKSLKFNEIGTLSFCNNLYDFEPAQSIFSTFGLSAVDIRFVDHNNNETDTNSVILPAPSKFTRSLHSIMKYAAMVALLISVGLILSTPLTSNYEEYEVVKASLSPINAIISTSDSSVTPDIAESPTLYIKNPVIDQSYASETDLEETDNYCLIIASLPSNELAEQFIYEHPDYCKGIIESNGRFRVYATTGTTAQSVMNSAIIAIFPDAWPCLLK